MNLFNTVLFIVKYTTTLPRLRCIERNLLQVSKVSLWKVSVNIPTVYS